jgi:hypothetical protein
METDLTLLWRPSDGLHHGKQSSTFLFRIWLAQETHLLTAYSNLGTCDDVR